MRNHSMRPGHSSDRSRIVIIGAGPTGLGAAWRLDREGFVNWVICEQAGEVGGLAGSHLDRNGFTWDIGGHVVFSHYELFTKLLDGLFEPSGWLSHQRESWIWMQDRWIPYPFQNNLYRLPPPARARCLTGLLGAASAKGGRGFASFDDFIVRTFGEGIADVFMRPYNRKVWAYAPEQLDASWIADRVAVPDAARVARNVAMRADDVSWGPNSNFRFPARGGTGAIWQRIAERLPPGRVLTNCKAERIDTRRRVVHLAGGGALPYDRLISTMPVDVLARICGRDDWMEPAAGLKHSSTHVIGVAVRGRPAESVASKCWMYFPDSSVPFYRLTHFSRYSPNNVPDISAHWSVMAEVSESPCAPVDAGAVVSRTIDGLVEAGIIEGRRSVLHRWHTRREYGYPTPSLGRDEILDRLLPLLERDDVYSRGRFGAWKYEVGNMDHSFMQGWEAAGRILHGGAEPTLRRPDFVNSSHPAARAWAA